jgi:DNA-binding protein YbaB
MIGDLFSKLMEARQKIEEAKKQLNNIYAEASVENGAICVKANANKSICSIKISGDWLKTNSIESLEELLAHTSNRALEDAALKGEVEMKKITRDMLPNFPGLI